MSFVSFNLNKTHHGTPKIVGVMAELTLSDRGIGGRRVWEEERWNGKEERREVKG